jgi:L-ascorbate metabolism protein UlaG (beta-lactamase superfamily)
MDISWLGHACIRLRAAGATLIMDPASRETGYDMARPNADVVTISHSDPAHGNVKGVRGEPLVLDGPGEYEVRGVHVLGAASWLSSASTAGAADEETPARQRNVIFVVEAEELRVAHLGGLATRLTAEQREQVGDVDVLIVPVGGERALAAPEVTRLARELEAKVVIPVRYTPDEQGLPPADLVRAAAVEPERPGNRFTIQRRSLGETLRLVVLDPRG